MRPRGYDVEQRDDDREVIRCPRPPVRKALQTKEETRTPGGGRGQDWLP